jgi:DNA-directed RNA polymerase subunit RPC12/RpoP
MSDEQRSTPPVHEQCPHCGTPLSPWEKVLLNVDRALMCKHCWYRIYLDATGEKPKPKRHAP